MGQLIIEMKIFINSTNFKKLFSIALEIYSIATNFKNCRNNR